LPSRSGTNSGLSLNFWMLREYNVAFVLQDQSWMPGPAELFEKYDPVTADFSTLNARYPA
jgi:hypothetical protein